MITRRRLRLHAHEGLTMIELLVSLAVFAMFVLMIDAVFFSANRTSRKVELAADVQQNARIAVERLTRELREGNLPGTTVDTSQGAGRHRIVFKSARLAGNSTVFCLYVRSNTEPLYNATCFDSFPGSSNDILEPNPFYTSAQLAADPRLGSYTPIWQQYIGYYVAENPPFSGQFELRRVSGQLSAATDIPSTGLLTGGTVVATFIDVDAGPPPRGFNVTQAGTNFTITLDARGTEFVQGTQVPAQQVMLPGGVVPRNP